MFPFRDENPTLRLPIATYLLIGMNIVVWVFVQGLGAAEPMARSLCLYALIPGDLLNTVADGTTFAVGNGMGCTISGDGDYTSIVSSMFMHGGWLHIIGNMLFLWVFGDNVEDVMGPGRFLAFYVLCGSAAAAAQIASDPASTVPMVGASGAIGGVMGAYAILFPRARVHLLVIIVFYITTVSVPAIFMLGYWFVLQLVSGLLSGDTTGGGVAFWAHIGGFAAGIVLVFAFRSRELMAAQARLTRRYQARHRWL